MKTKNKIEKKVSIVENSTGIPATVIKGTLPPNEEKVKITSFDGDFGRVDINQLRDKVNEIIAFLNK